MKWAIGAVVALVLLVAFAAAARSAGREKYGPPPGRQRAVALDELDSRGWPEFPLEYTGDTASSVSHLVLRSA